ncbi:MAG: 5-formyltetrahydrofolate cyclo-ligase [Mitsuokella jalaludinii]|uniref:5-formyltetrahydrofolate cyclo-ligase n=2 Tax=Mitsuokella jalaludinii TaxID=187979 RepID=UPI00242C3691|nr:5-formyltetrahydrofolate cyclo-ligase [Mitsuokella jalaludinii]MDD7745668.1 5-formyltetrahydrofolate cyclo-ligase [Mitsuokella jalaludinii]
MTPRELHEVKLAEKKALRQKMLAFRKGLTKEQHEAKSRAILARLYEEPRFQQAKTIFAYASMPDEVQLYDLLAHALKAGKAGKRVGLPLITGKGLMEAVTLPSLAALVPGKFGILTVRQEEQSIIPADEVDFVVVPGAAFSSKGERLGLGGGYYDRYLMEKAPQAYRAALTFDGQVVASVPMEAHDAKVNLILTETRRIEPNT